MSFWLLSDVRVHPAIPDKGGKIGKIVVATEEILGFGYGRYYISEHRITAPLYLSQMGLQTVRKGWADFSGGAPSSRVIAPHLEAIA